MRETAYVFILVSSVPVLLTALYTSIMYRQLVKELRIFAWFVIFSGIIELFSKILWITKTNNMPLLHIYVAGGFYFLLLFYREVLKGFIEQRIMNGILILFMIFTTINSLFIQDIYSFNSYALTTESLLLIILSILTFMVMMNDVVKRRRESLAKSLTWINSGILIYYSSSLIIFIFAKFFFLDLSFKIFSQDFNLQTWMLHAFFANVMYVCFFAAIWNRPPLRMGKD